jgi:hypothetical protein
MILRPCGSSKRPREKNEQDEGGSSKRPREENEMCKSYTFNPFEEGVGEATMHVRDVVLVANYFLMTRGALAVSRRPLAISQVPSHNPLTTHYPVTEP